MSHGSTIMSEKVQLNTLGKPLMHARVFLNEKSEGLIDLSLDLAVKPTLRVLSCYHLSFKRLYTNGINCTSIGFFAIKLTTSKQWLRFHHCICLKKDCTYTFIDYF